jgi:hypothetical protein
MSEPRTATAVPPPAVSAGDRPPVPGPPPPSLRSRGYLVLGTGAVLAYLAAGMLGWDLPTTEQATVPATVRTAPGGYRTFHFWHTGYHGGK